MSVNDVFVTSSMHLRRSRVVWREFSTVRLPVISALTTSYGVVIYHLKPPEYEVAVASSVITFVDDKAHRSIIAQCSWSHRYNGVGDDSDDTTCKGIVTMTSVETGQRNGFVESVSQRFSNGTYIYIPFEIWNISWGSKRMQGSPAETKA